MGVILSRSSRWVPWNMIEYRARCRRYRSRPTSVTCASGATPCHPGARSRSSSIRCRSLCCCATFCANAARRCWSARAVCALSRASVAASIAPAAPRGSTHARRAGTLARSRCDEASSLGTRTVAYATHGRSSCRRTWRCGVHVDACTVRDDCDRTVGRRWHKRRRLHPTTLRVLTPRRVSRREYRKGRCIGDLCCR